MEKQTHRQMEVKIQPPPPEAAVGMGNEFSRTTFIFKYFQGLDFAAFKFKDQGVLCG